MLVLLVSDDLDGHLPFDERHFVSHFSCFTYVFTRQTHALPQLVDNGGDEARLRALEKLNLTDDTQRGERHKRQGSRLRAQETKRVPY